MRPRKYLYWMLFCFSCRGISGSLYGQSLEQQEPAWWSASGTKIWTGVRVNVENYSAINAGQLKHVAAMARVYLDTKLAAFGGAGPEIAAAVDAFPGRGTASPQAERDQNAAAANVGQLKQIGDLFYRRLWELGIDAAADVQSRLHYETKSLRPGKDYFVPWDTAAPAAENAMVANVGQLKIVFGFQLEYNLDTDADGLPDSWEIKHFNSIAAHDGTSDSDGDGLSNIEEVLIGTSPAGNSIGGTLRSVVVTYDALDRLKGVTGSGKSAAFTFDNAGNILTSSHTP